MKSNSSWMKASLQQQQVFCLENIATTIGKQYYCAQILHNYINHKGMLYHTRKTKNFVR